MRRISFTLFLLICFGWLSACQPALLEQSLAHQQTATTSALASLEPSEALATPTVQETPAGPVHLRLWVPPEFNPASGSPAGSVLQSRLDEFLKRRPDVRLEVRVKALNGPSGMIETLASTTAVAPLALPGLVALPRNLLESAALKGLLHPYDQLTTNMESDDWYPYAQELAYIQNSLYGLPFAGDALVVVYRPSSLSDLPQDWENLLTLGMPLLFPAADPTALFTITQYQAKGGKVLDDQGRPYLDAGVLQEVFEFYARAEQAGLLPYWLAQYQTDDQVWGAVEDRRVDLAVTWASNFLKSGSAEMVAAPLPTPTGNFYTLASGWVWALVEADPAKQKLYVELAEFLTEARFLAAWNQALGYLPPRPAALQGWEDERFMITLRRVAVSARLLPSGDVLTSLGIPLQQATVQVIKKQNDPSTAAQAASQAARPGLTSP